MITFYDIDNKTKTAWSPNTLKTKLALAHKGLLETAKVEWVSYPDIAELLKSKDVPKCPGPPTVNWTLPAIETDGKTIMDSWAIAKHLEAAYPDKPSLFPNGTEGLSRFIYPYMMAQIGRPLFPLILPKQIDFLDDKGAKYFRKTREADFGPISHDIYQDKDRIEGIWNKITPSIKMVGSALKEREGPYLLGNERSYADIQIICFLEWYRVVNRELYDRLVAIEPTFGELYEACKELLE